MNTVARDEQQQQHWRKQCGTVGERPGRATSAMPYRMENAAPAAAIPGGARGEGRGGASLFAFPRLGFPRRCADGARGRGKRRDTRGGLTPDGGARSASCGPAGSRSGPFSLFGCGSVTFRARLVLQRQHSGSAPGRLARRLPCGG